MSASVGGQKVKLVGFATVDIEAASECIAAIFACSNIQKSRTISENAELVNTQSTTACGKKHLSRTASTFIAVTNALLITTQTSA